MLRVIRVDKRGVMEILGLVEPDSPNPRRNTSKDFFEVLQNGNREATRCHFVAASIQDPQTRGNKAATCCQLTTNYPQIMSDLRCPEDPTGRASFLMKKRSSA